MFLSAYFSNNWKPIEALMENEGITHIIINKKHFILNDYPKYFSPFNSATEKIFNLNNGKYFLSNYIISCLTKWIKFWR